MPQVRTFALGKASTGPDLLALAASGDHTTPRDESQPSDIATLNYTGGTTGRQKGVVRNSAQVTQMAITMNSELQIPDAPQYLAIAAISHVSGPTGGMIGNVGQANYMAAKMDVFGWDPVQ